MNPFAPQTKPALGTSTKPEAASKTDSDSDFFVAEKIHRLLIRAGEKEWKAMEPAGGDGGRGGFAGGPGGRGFPGGRGQGGFPEGPGGGGFPGGRGQGGFPEGPGGGGFPRGRGQGGFPGGPGPMQTDFPVVEASVTIDNTPLTVGLRYKGNSTFRMTAGTDKRPYKIDFNEFVDKQKFRGHTKLSANPDAADPSHLRETLAFEIFRAMKVPAPRTTFAEVSLATTGQSPRNIGLYTLVENIDDPLLDQWFGEHKGLLVKPEGANGLRHLGDSWAPYERVYDPKGKPSSAQKRALIDLTKLVHTEDTAQFQRQIGTVLDIDNFLRFLAVNVVLSNADSFLSMGHNFYLYRSEKTGKFHFLPWDLNHAFGGFPGGADPVRLSLRKPHSGSSPLIERLLAIPEHRERYLAHVRAAQALVRAASGRIARLRDLVRPAVARESPSALAVFDRQFDPKAEIANGRFGGGRPQPGSRPDNDRANAPDRTANPGTPNNSGNFPNQGFGPGRRPGGPDGPGMSAPPLVAFIAKRMESVDAQLAGKDNGAEPSGFGPGGGRGGFPGGPGGQGGFPGGPGGFPGGFPGGPGGPGGGGFPDR